MIGRLSLFAMASSLRTAHHREPGGAKRCRRGTMQSRPDGPPIGQPGHREVVGTTDRTRGRPRGRLHGVAGPARGSRAFVALVLGILVAAVTVLGGAPRA